MTLETTAQKWILHILWRQNKHYDISNNNTAYLSHVMHPPSVVCSFTVSVGNSVLKFDCLLKASVMLNFLSNLSAPKCSQVFFSAGSWQDDTASSTMSDGEQCDDGILSIQPLTALSVDGDSRDRLKRSHGSAGEERQSSCVTARLQCVGDDSFLLQTILRLSRSSRKTSNGLKRARVVRCNNCERDCNNKAAKVINKCT